MTRRTPPKCACGATYHAFRTGLCFADVRQLMRDQPDRDGRWEWRQKRRRSVLGYWRELKIGMWYQLHGMCDAD